MFSTFALIDLSIFISGFVFVLKKVADMDRYQTLRTVVLTMILGAIVVYFILMFASDGQLFEPACDPEHFCMTEM
jgi:ABC-type transport system involved in cytochrome c biogenesis permease subunit